jgi:hypothetical protein
LPLSAPAPEPAPDTPRSHSARSFHLSCSRLPPHATNSFYSSDTAPFTTCRCCTDRNLLAKPSLCIQASLAAQCGFIEFQPGLRLPIIAGLSSSSFSSSSKRSRIASSVKRLALGLAKQFQTLRQSLSALDCSPALHFSTNVCPAAPRLAPSQARPAIPRTHADTNVE